MMTQLLNSTAGDARAAMIDGKAIALSVTSQTKRFAAKFRERAGRPPGLAVVIVGDDPASTIYVRSKGLTAMECGFLSLQENLPADVGEDNLVSVIARLNDDPSIDGILVQLPLPPQISAKRIIQAIAPEKDVDGFTFVNIGMLGAGDIGDALIPCTPAGSMLLIERVRGRDLSGLHAVVVGRSNIVGKPMAQLLLAANATVTMAHQPHRRSACALPHRRHSRRRGRTRRHGRAATGSSRARPSSMSASTASQRPSAARASRGSSAMSTRRRRRGSPARSRRFREASVR